MAFNDESPVGYYTLIGFISALCLILLCICAYYDLKQRYCKTQERRLPDPH